MHLTYRGFTIRHVAAVLGSGLLLLVWRPLSAQDARSRELGAWQRHEHAFAFLGFTSTYSCDGLADKLRLLLIAAGARSDVKARPGACAASFGRPDEFARAQLTFYTLTPTGLAGPPSEGKPVEGTWRLVTISDRHPSDLATGDCEFVEQFSAQVLPLFSIRNQENHTTCIPHQISGSVIDLSFESFSALVPSKPDGAERAPPAHRGL